MQLAPPEKISPWRVAGFAAVDINRFNSGALIDEHGAAAVAH